MNIYIHQYYNIFLKFSLLTLSLLLITYLVTSPHPPVYPYIDYSRPPNMLLGHLPEMTMCEGP